MQQGHAFMGLLWSDQAYLLEDQATSKVAGKIGYSLIPSNTSQRSSQLEGLTYLVPTESQHPKEAYRFIEWAMSAQVQIQQTLNGSTSIRKSVYEDSRVKEQAIHAGLSGKCSYRQGETDDTGVFTDDGGGGTPPF